MSENLSELRQLIVVEAGGVSWFDNRQSIWRSAARKSQLSYSKIKRIWYGDISERDTAVRLLRKRQQLREEQRRSAILANRFEAIAQAMDATNPNIYRKDVTRLRNAVRALRQQTDGGFSDGTRDPPSS